MKIEEVVKELNNIRDGFREWTGLNARGEEVFRIAIEALEKQIPKKFKLVGNIPICPVCGEEVWDMEWCNNCGQHLSDEYVEVENEN